MAAPAETESTSHLEVDSPPLIDLGVGVAFVAFGATLIYGAQEFPVSVPNTVIGPGLLPMICAVVFLLGGAALSIRAFMAARRGARVADSEEGEGGSLTFSAVILGGMVLTILIMPYLGFIVTTALYAFAVTLAGKTRWYGAALSAALITAIVYFVFSSLMRVPLPAASLF